MNLSRFLSADRIVDLAARDKAGALKELSAVLATSKDVTDGKAFQKAIVEREAILSTGIGLGIAVPHAKVASVKDFTVAIGRSKSGIEWDSLDGHPVTIIVMIAASDKQAAEYTKLLAALVTRVKPDEMRRKMLAASKPEDVLALLAD